MAFQEMGVHGVIDAQVSPPGAFILVVRLQLGSRHPRCSVSPTSHWKEDLAFCRRGKSLLKQIFTNLGRKAPKCITQGHFYCWPILMVMKRMPGNALETTHYESYAAWEQEHHILLPFSAIAEGKGDSTL